MARITLQDVTKRFGDVEAIKGISTELKDGCLTVIVGPSGSGKTSLLRAIAGLEGISSGRILIDDRDVTDLPPRDRDAAFVFQNYALYGHMNVRDNIAFPLRARKVPKAERHRMAAEVAQRTGLQALLERRPSELSGGQQQRVAIARAIIRRPAVFLFDEPLSNLDAQLRIEMRQEILRMRETMALTAVWVTHDQEEAMALGDEIIVVNEGRIAQQATPDELYTKPATIYVARMIGSPSMNLFAGTLQDGRFTGPIDARVDAGLGSGEVTLGFRPEDVQLIEDVESSEGIGVLRAEVEIVELLGPRGIVTMRVGAESVTGVFDRRTVNRLRGHDTIEIGVHRSNIHLFDSATERRLPSTSQPRQTPMETRP